MHPDLVQQPFVARSEAIALGVPPRSWARAHARGDYVAVFPGISIRAGTELTTEQRVAAAVASIGGALASHRTATRLWDVAPDGADPSGDEPIDVLLPFRRRVSPRPGVVIHRTRDGLDLTPSHRRTIACTNPLRTLTDLGAVAPDWVAEVFARMAIAGLVGAPAARAALARHSRHGRDGLGALRRALDEWPLGDDRPDSMFEVGFARLLRAAGIDDFVFHHRVAGMEVDFAWPTARLVVECDGFEHHGDRPAFERDRRRDAILVAAGWRVIRVTWLQFVEDRSGVIDRLRRSLIS